MQKEHEKCLEIVFHSIAQIEPTLINNDNNNHNNDINNDNNNNDMIIVIIMILISLIIVIILRPNHRSKRNLKGVEFQVF